MQAQQQQEVQFTGSYDWAYLLQVCQGYGDSCYSALEITQRLGFTKEAYDEVLYWWSTWL